MKNNLCIIIITILLMTGVYADDTTVDNLLEKVQQSNTKEEKDIFLAKLKLELTKINKKAREESNAIIEAKKKIPSKPFSKIN